MPKKQKVEIPNLALKEKSKVATSNQITNSPGIKSPEKSAIDTTQKIISGIQITVSTSPNATGVLQKSTISVDSAGTQNESVIQDIAFINPATGTVALDPSRFTMTFTITAGTWAWNSTVAYP